MATKLVMDFKDGNGDTVRISYNYADPEVQTSSVKALVNGIIANGSFFTKPPVSASAAKLVTTTETAIDLSD